MSAIGEHEPAEEADRTDGAEDAHDTAGVGDAVAPADRHDAYAALRTRDFRLFLGANFLATLGEQMLAVAIGWELYVRTRSALALGLVGLVQIIPVILLALPAGHLADRRDRRHLVLITEVTIAACSLGLALLSGAAGPIPLFYACLLVFGIALAFNTPANSSLVPQIVPEAVFRNAASWSSSSWQLAAVIGPALGGALIAFTGYSTVVYVVNALTCAVVIGLIAAIRSRRALPPTKREPVTLRELGAGFGFVRHTPVILAAITLDLFAVLLGGAVMLLPIYALDILHVGATGLGLLRAAPSVGAVTMALGQAHRPPYRHAGRALLLAVAGFGLATIVFGVSHSFPLSLAMLLLLGALDNISVVIRSTLLLTRAPDEIRGRVYAVNGIFVGASNELGGFESGLAAALFGPVLAVVLGGAGTVVVVAAVALIWPQIRQLGKL